MKWVKPDKEVPELGNKVLVRYKSGYVGLNEYYGSRDWWERNIEKWLDEPLSEEPNQDQLWDELKETVHNASLHSYISRVAMDRLKGKYTITRKL